MFSVFYILTQTWSITVNIWPVLWLEFVIQVPKWTLRSSDNSYRLSNFMKHVNKPFPWNMLITLTHAYRHSNAWEICTKQSDAQTRKSRLSWSCIFFLRAGRRPNDQTLPLYNTLYNINSMFIRHPYEKSIEVQMYSAEDWSQLMQDNNM